MILKRSGAVLLVTGWTRVPFKYCKLQIKEISLLSAIMLQFKVAKFKVPSKPTVTNPLCGSTFRPVLKPMKWNHARPVNKQC